MTLVVKKYTDERPLTFGCVASVSVSPDDILIIDSRVFLTSQFEYIKDADTGKYYVKNGQWVESTREVCEAVARKEREVLDESCS